MAFALRTADALRFLRHALFSHRTYCLTTTTRTTESAALYCDSKGTLGQEQLADDKERDCRTVRAE